MEYTQNQLESMSKLMLNCVASEINNSESLVDYLGDWSRCAAMVDSFNINTSVSDEGYYLACDGYMHDSSLTIVDYKYISVSDSRNRSVVVVYIMMKQYKNKEA